MKGLSKGRYDETFAGEDGKDQESIQSSTIADPGHRMEK